MSGPIARAGKKAAKRATKKAARRAARPVKKAGRGLKRKAGRQLLKGAMSLFSGYRVDQPGIDDLADLPGIDAEDQDNEPGQRDGFDPLDRLEPLSEWDRKRSIR